jgi:hypothetical protein
MPSASQQLNLEHYRIVPELEAAARTVGIDVDWEAILSEHSEHAGEP